MSARRKVIEICLTALVGLCGMPHPAQAAAIDLSEIGFEFDGGLQTLGWRFTVNGPVIVESLGVYDSGQDGLAGPAEVGLWPATGGDPLALVTVPSGTGAILDGYFRFVPITPTILSPGTEYIVGAYLPGELVTSLFGGNGLVDPHVAVLDVRYSGGGDSIGFPNLTDPGTEGAAFLGGNFRLSPVPLPATAWLFGSGVVGLGSLAMGRMWKRRATVQGRDSCCSPARTAVRLVRSSS